jgi:hypothetical protein
MANLDGFDATTVDPNVGFDPLPAGDYTVMMIDSEFKATKKEDGEYLQCTWEVIDGEHKKRLVFDRLNLKNANETAVKIAMSTLSAICHAVGVMKPKDSAELHGKPVIATVSLEERNDKPGSYSNRIYRYSAVGAAKIAPAASKTTEAAVPPWKRKG